VKRTLIALTLAALGFTLIGCQNANSTNTNANTAETTTAGPDNSQITTTTDNKGTRTETRVFSNNPRVSNVVVTTRNGQRTTTVYSKTGESREINDAGDALSATGDKLADSAGWVANKTEPVVDKTKEGVKEVGDKAEDVKDKTTSTAKTVGHETKEGAKTVANKAASVTKKTGKTLKKIVTP